MAGLMALVALTTSGCGHKVALSYLAPAQIELGPNVERVLLLDHSEQGDPETRKAVLQALHNTLERSERFDSVVVGEGAVRPREIHALCERVGCDAVVALDALTSAGFIEVEPRGGKNGLRAPVYTSTDEVSMDAHFRVTSDKGKPLDEATLSLTPDALPPRSTDAIDNGLLDALAKTVGASYGQRIAPHEEVGVRTLYQTGSPGLRAGFVQAQAGQWSAAAESWREVAKSSPHANDVAKARHNLAVAAEREGRLDRALQLARNADDVLARQRTSEYVLVLEQRWVDNKRMSRRAPGSIACAGSRNC